jgi:alpha-tubulin suppressor-like RCC1 family protein
MHVAARAGAIWSVLRSIVVTMFLVCGAGCGDVLHTAAPQGQDSSPAHEADAGSDDAGRSIPVQPTDGGTVSGSDAAVERDAGQDVLDAGASQCAGCWVDDHCYASGERSARAPCMRCDPATSRVELMAMTNLSCDDGDACTDDDACLSGVCRGTAKTCSDGVSCNGEETCASDTGECTPGESTCDEGSYCNAGTDTCDPTCLGCRIEGSCLPAGLHHPTDPCLICDPRQSTVTWSASAFAVCGTASECSLGAHCDLQGRCVVDAVEKGTDCGPASTDCSRFSCDGQGACMPAHPVAGTECGVHAPCEAQDLCDGQGACHDEGMLALASVCVEHGICAGDPAAPACTCVSGFEAVDGACRDIDECARGETSCDRLPDACVNTEGSYACACPGASTGSGEGMLGCACARADWSPTCSPWTALSLNRQHACAISDGRLYCWGRGDNGQLGQGDLSSQPHPSRVGTASDWLSVSTGLAHTCAIRHGGELYCWGRNAVYALGVGDTRVRLVPARVGSDADWTQVSTGNGFTCGLRAQGLLYCWGYAGDGALGMGNYGPHVQVPKQVWNVTGMEQVRCGDSHSCALRQGQVYCWGNNQMAELGDGTSWDSTSPLAVPGFSDFVALDTGFVSTCARRANGELYCWGALFEQSATGLGPRRVGSDSDWTSVALGSQLWCGTRASGVGYCWGEGGAGQVGDDALGHRYAPSALAGGGAWDVIEAGSSTACGLKDGGLYCWGSNDFGTRGTGFGVTRIGEGGDFTAVSTSSLSSCAIDRAGALSCWGQRFDATGNVVVVADPTPVSEATDWLAVATGSDAGKFFACGIRAPGDLYCWGWGQGAAGATDSEKVLAPRLVGDVHDYISVSAYGAHACALRAGGELRCWGSNGYGQLGDGTTTLHLAPAPVSFAGFSSVSAGITQTCGLSADNALCWGSNSRGELGLARSTTAAQLTPDYVAGGLAFSSVVAGGGHSCGVVGGALYCWGSNGAGQQASSDLANVMQPKRVGTDTDFSALALGAAHTCAIKLDGSLFCWGANLSGQLGGDAQGMTRIAHGTGWQALSAAGTHTCGVRAGQIVCFGTGIELQQGYAQGRVPRPVYEDFDAR